MADTTDLKSVGLLAVWVRVPHPGPTRKGILMDEQQMELGVFSNPAFERAILDLGKVFHIPISSTLKMKLKKGEDWVAGINAARRFLANENSSYTRIEFAHGGFYFVVAKLGVTSKAEEE